MDYIINAALQILPKSHEKDAYTLVDKAIEVIQQSGLTYKVCPFETVIEGRYEEVMETIYKAQKACLHAGAYEYIANIKLQVNKSKDIRIEEKISKYETKKTC